MSDNLYCLLESAERRALRVVVKLDPENVIDIVGIGVDVAIEEVEVDASGRRSAEEVGVPVTEI